MAQQEPFNLKALARQRSLQAWGTLHPGSYRKYQQHLFVFERLGFTLFLNPKVATTFLKRRICEHFLGDENPVGLAHLGRVYRDLPFLASNVHPSTVASCLTSHNVRRFLLVRNPYGRLLSAYRDKICRRTCYTYDKELPHLRAFAKSQGLVGEGETLPVPFDTFVRWVTASPLQSLNGHWGEQTGISLYDRIDYSDLFHIEDGLSPLLEQLGECLNGGSEWDVQREKKADNQNSKTEVLAYTPELAELVYKKYSRDFRAFAYSRDSWQGL